MRYSYIKPRQKTILTPELKLLMSFFSVTFFMLFTTYGFLLYKNHSFVEGKKEIVQRIGDLNQSIFSMRNEIAFIENEKELATSIFTHNSVLKESIANLFDLVPQQITLSKATLLKNGLILQGVTPNRDVYNFMLQAPLRSIFAQTYSSFYPASNGWLFFVSKNYVDSNQTLISTQEEQVDEN